MKRDEVENIVQCNVVSVSVYLSSCVLIELVDKNNVRLGIDALIVE